MGTMQEASLGNSWQVIDTSDFQLQESEDLWNVCNSQLGLVYWREESMFFLIYLIAILGYPQLNLIPTNIFKNTQLLVNHKLLKWSFRKDLDVNICHWKFIWPAKFVWNMIVDGNNQMGQFWEQLAGNRYQWLPIALFLLFQRLTL